MVPIPGICFSGIQNNKTITLIKKVDAPILKLVTLLTPSASTVHGLTPMLAAINIGILLTDKNRNLGNT